MFVHIVSKTASLPEVVEAIELGIPAGERRRRLQFSCCREAGTPDMAE